MKDLFMFVIKNPYSQKQIDILRSENENLKSDMKFLRKQLNDVETGEKIFFLICL
jgi:hypothetical protein